MLAQKANLTMHLIDVNKEVGNRKCTLLLICTVVGIQPS